MAVLKVIEVLGNSKVSFEDAVQNVINEASKSVKNIKSVINKFSIIYGNLHIF